MAVAADGLAHRHGKILPHAAKPRMHRERPTKHPRGLARPAERHVAEPRARQRAEIMGIARASVSSSVGDPGAFVVLGDVAARSRSLVPALGERWGACAIIRAKIASAASTGIAPLHEGEALAQERIDLAIARTVPHLPQRRLGACRRRLVAPEQCFQSLVFGHGAPSLRRVGAKSKMAPDMAARFTGKVVLITGGAGGIGRAAAVRFASEGARVVVVDLAAVRPPGRARPPSRRSTARVHAVEADVTKLAEVQKYADAAVKRFGGIDVFFNNAGVLGALKPLVDYPEETFDRVIAQPRAGGAGVKHVRRLSTCGRSQEASSSDARAR